MKNVFNLLVGISFLLFFSCSSSPKVNNQNVKEASQDKIEKISYSVAVEKARKFVDSKEWILAGISNTGSIIQNITSSEMLHSPSDKLMDKDGNSGQWVIEFYKNSPKAIHEGDQKGFNYAFRAICVTSKSVRDGAATDDGINTKNTFSPLKEVYINNLLKAFRTGEKKAGEYDVASISSHVTSNGETHWYLRFYDIKTGEIVAKIAVSGDGTKID